MPRVFCSCLYCLFGTHRPGGIAYPVPPFRVACSESLLYPLTSDNAVDPEMTICGFRHTTLLLCAIRGSTAAWLGATLSSRLTWRSPQLGAARAREETAATAAILLAWIWLKLATEPPKQDATGMLLPGSKEGSLCLQFSREFSLAESRQVCPSTGFASPRYRSCLFPTSRIAFFLFWCTDRRT